MSLEENIVKHKKVLEILSKHPEETNELKALKILWERYHYLVNLCDTKNLPIKDTLGKVSLFSKFM